MGKIITEETISMAAKMHAPTSEQLRIAQLLGDKPEDNAATKDKCQKIMETTGCSESNALIALHDCNNCIEDAVHKILDGTTEQGEWTTKFRKQRKSHNYSSKENEITPSSDDFMADESMNVMTGAANTITDSNNRSLSNRMNGGGRRGGVGGAGSGGFKASSDMPPSRGRGRGAIRGQFRDRRRGGNENESVNAEQSQERPPQRPGRNGGSGRGFNDSARGGRGGVRGGSSRRQNNDSGFDGSMSTWSNNETESNTWDNSMASRWSNNNNNSSNRQPSGGVGEWKSPDGTHTSNNNNNNSSNVAKVGNANANSSNTWDNSMAHNVVQQPANQNSSSNAQPLASANHVDDWNPADDWGEEVDWQKMTNRVFTNMNQQQKPVGPAVNPIINNSTFISNVSEPKTSDPTGITSHIRGESIDVNLLFGQKPSSEVSALNDASGSWSKQATDTLKSELGIGKVVSPSIEQTQLISRTSRQYPSKPATAKVEMPNSAANVGQIDVEFGEFSSIKMRPSTEETATNYFEFGTATAFTSTDLNLSAQSAKEKNVVSGVPANVYQRTPSKEAQVNGAPPVVEMPHPGSSVVAQGASLKDSAAAVAAAAVVAKNATAAEMLSSSYPNPASQAFIGQDQFSNRSSSLLNSAAQQKSQSVGNVTSSESNNVAQLAKESNVGQSIISLSSVQNIAGLGYSTTANRAAVTTTAVSKPLLNTTTIFNPATNPSYQALAAAMPYIYPAADQNYLNAATLGFLSPHGIPFNTLGTLPFDLSSLNQVAPLANNAPCVRDTQNMGGNNDVKQYGRSEIAISGANSINAPPGLGPATVNNAEQAAQLLAPAAAAAAAYHPYSLMNTMQAPYFAPFVVPTVTNSSASNSNSGNQYPKNSVFASPVFYGGGDLQLPQDYGKNIYGVNMATNQNKQAAQANMSMNAGEMNNKAYAPTLKMAFDAKAFQNTATPPPGLGGVGFPTAFHSSGTYGAYPQFLPPQIGMMPPNMAQAATINANDVISGAGQRAGNPASKTGANLYGAKGYWPT